MALHLAAGRGLVGQHEHPSDLERLPPGALRHDARPQSGLHVLWPQGLLNGDEARVDLDDQEGARRRMPRDKVDRPALTVDRERHLGLDDPAEPLEHGRSQRDKPGMVLVDQPV